MKRKKSARRNPSADGAMAFTVPGRAMAQPPGGLRGRTQSNDHGQHTAQKPSSRSVPRRTRCTSPKSCGSTVVGASLKMGPAWKRRQPQPQWTGQVKHSEPSHSEDSHQLHGKHIGRKQPGTRSISTSQRPQREGTEPQNPPRLQRAGTVAAGEGGVGTLFPHLDAAQAEAQGVQRIRRTRMPCVPCVYICGTKKPPHPSRSCSGSGPGRGDVSEQNQTQALPGTALPVPLLLWP